jgi:xanthine dehydrogenase accessory factor
VVRVEGSAYRRPGARMLVGEAGILEGSVSGGCLEKDVLLRAQAAMAKARPIVLRYDSVEDEEEFTGFRMGCNGVIDILIEPALSQLREIEFPFLTRCREARIPCLVAKVIALEGSVPLTLGGYLLMDSLGEGQVLQSCCVDKLVLEAAKGCLEKLTSTRQIFELPGGKIEVFFEVLNPPTPLILFGTGPDVPPLMRMAKELGFDVMIVDPRGTYFFPGRFGAADSHVSGRPALLSSQLTLSAHTAAVVMTHNYPLDLELMDLLMPSPLCYLGLLGPRKRTDRLLSELAARGKIFSSTELQRLYAPVGLDLGTDSPEAIALSILSEIQAVLSHREGGFLRGRTGPIHGARL